MHVPTRPTIYPNPTLLTALSNDAYTLIHVVCALVHRLGCKEVQTLSNESLIFPPEASEERTPFTS
jgi:hypothetical protein